MHSSLCRHIDTGSQTIVRHEYYDFLSLSKMAVHVTPFVHSKDKKADVIQSIPVDLGDIHFRFGAETFRWP